MFAVAVTEGTFSFHANIFSQVKTMLLILKKKNLLESLNKNDIL